MRKAIAGTLFFAALSVFAATETPQLGIPCNGPGLSPVTTMAVEGDAVVFHVNAFFQPCPFTFYSSTPEIIEVGRMEPDGSGAGYQLTVYAKKAGVGVVSVNALGKARNVATIDVDSCAAGSHAIELQPLYTAAAGARVSIDAEVVGTFSRGLQWLLNGQYLGNTPSVSFLPAAPGVYQLELRGESACGITSAKAQLVVGGRPHAVRRR